MREMLQGLKLYCEDYSLDKANILYLENLQSKNSLFLTMINMDIPPFLNCYDNFLYPLYLYS